jgi:hypothetical protein
MFFSLSSYPKSTQKLRKPSSPHSLSSDFRKNTLLDADQPSIPLSACHVSCQGRWVIVLMSCIAYTTHSPRHRTTAVPPPLLLLLLLLHYLTPRLHVCYVLGSSHVITILIIILVALCTAPYTVQRCTGLDTCIGILPRHRQL